MKITDTKSKNIEYESFGHGNYHHTSPQVALMFSHRGKEGHRFFFYNSIEKKSIHQLQTLSRSQLLKKKKSRKIDNCAVFHSFFIFETHTFIVNTIIVPATYESVNFNNIAEED